MIAFPDPGASGGRSAEIQRRWNALFEKAPRLKPWLAELLQRERRLLAERGEPGIDAQLWAHLSRLLRQFEALPQFAVSAISIELQEDKPAASREDELDEDAASDDSPEGAAADLEMLVGDPAFALAFHCIEARVLPALPKAPSLAGVPRPAWLGLLHAASPQRPVLSAETAVSLVLRSLSAQFAELPAAARNAAMRLFCAGETDLKNPTPLRRLVEVLPREWRLAAEGLPDFVAGSLRARVGLSEAAGLCARLVASAMEAAKGRAGARLGGLSQLQENSGERASPEEVAEVARAAMVEHRSGLQRLVALLGPYPRP